MTTDRQIGYFTKRNGAQIAYSTGGTGSPIVFVPGWVGSVDSPLNAEGLAVSRGHLAIQYDKQGTGLSARELDSAAGFDRHAEEVVQLLDHLQIERAALYGGSQSGPVVLDVAARFPERVSRIVVIAGYAKGSGLFKGAASRAMAELVRNHWGYGSKVLTDMFRMTPTQEEADAFAKWMRQCAEPEVAARLLEEIYDVDISHRLGAISAPALIVHRRGDQAIPYRGGQAVAAAIPGAVFMALEGSAHGLGNEPDTTAVIARIQAFLNEDEAPTPAAPFRTILFTDVVASTPLLTQLRDARMREVMRDHDAVMAGAVTRHGGRVVKTIGDAFMAEFAVPSAALEAAIEAQRAIQERFSGSEIPIRVRIGVNAGEPIQDGGDLHGASVVIAKRLESAAEAGSILVSDVVKQAVSGKEFAFESRGSIELKGFPEPVRAWAVRWE